MPTAQNVFPKIGGDPLYYTEANRFAGAGQFISMGSTGIIGSQTADAVAGSILINAGSLSNPAHLIIDALVTRAATPIGVLISISGLSSNGLINVGSNIDTTQIIVHCDITAGSIFNGLMRAEARRSATTNVDYITDRSKYTAATTSSLHTGSPVVISFGFRENTGNSNFDSFSVQSFRGAL